jgi:hypothetical protein
VFENPLKKGSGVIFWFSLYIIIIILLTTNGTVSIRGNIRTYTQSQLIPHPKIIFTVLIVVVDHPVLCLGV